MSLTDAIRTFVLGYVPVGIVWPFTLFIIFFSAFVFVLRLTSRVCPASALPVSVLKSYPSLSHHCYYVSVCILLSFSCFSILRVFLFLISRLKLPVLCLDTSWSRGYTCSVPASFCRWSAKPVLSSFASGLSRTPFLGTISHLHSEINWDDGEGQVKPLFEL